MKDVLLTKDDIPIEDGRRVVIPIHPILLDKNNLFDEELAYEIFPDAIQEWEKDLKSYAYSYNDPETRSIREALPRLFGGISSWNYKKGQYENQYVERRHHEAISKPSDTIFRPVFAENGFAHSLKLNNFAIFVDEFEKNHSLLIEKYTKLSGIKKEIYKDAKAYSQFGIGSYSQALLARNMGILYVNAAMSKALDKS